MKLILSSVNKNCGDYTCEYCLKPVSEIIQLTYFSDKKDIHDNELIYHTLEICEKCSPKVERGYKKLLN